MSLMSFCQLCKFTMCELRQLYSCQFLARNLVNSSSTWYFLFHKSLVLIKNSCYNLYKSKAFVIPFAISKGRMVQNYPFQPSSFLQLFLVIFIKKISLYLIGIWKVKYNDTNVRRLPWLKSIE